MKSIYFLHRLLLSCLCGVLFSGCANSGLHSLNREKAHHNFALVLATVQKNYVDEVSAEVLVSDAIESMYSFVGVAPLSDAELLPYSPNSVSDVVAERDPLSRFDSIYGYLWKHLTIHPVNAPVPLAADKKTITTTQIDIGLLLTKSGEWIRIAAVTIGSAAEGAGLNRGDAIIAIDGQPTEGKSLSWCYQQLNGTVGSVVEISVNTEEGSVIDYRITRTRVRAPTIVMLEKLRVESNAYLLTPISPSL